MTSTRRQFAWTIAAAAGAAGLLRPSIAAAQDDDLPANVFISPAGRPYRAPPGAPYPVGTWFSQADTNSDGKLDHAEFMADAGAFFNDLDLNGDGVLDGYEIAIYEHRVAPEILGGRFNVSALRPGLVGARLWLAQMTGPSGPEGDHEPVEAPQKPDVDESTQGAVPYSFFGAPEPVTAADVEMRGYVRKPDYMALMGRRFSVLDPGNVGFLTLAGLPKTPAQLTLEHAGHRRR